MLINIFNRYIDLDKLIFISPLWEDASRQIIIGSLLQFTIGQVIIYDIKPTEIMEEINRMQAL